MYFEDMLELFLGILLLGNQTLASPNDLKSGNWAEWKDAKSFYDVGKYEDALRALQQHPQESASYYYNLGTLFFQNGNLGQSVGYLEKANRLNPHDPDTQYHLSIARSALGRALGEDKVDPASSWLEGLADRISLEEVRTTLGLLAMIVILLWIRAYWATRNIKAALFKISGLLGILGFSITAGIYGIQRWANSCPPAISLERLSVRSGPGEHYLELSQIEAGAKLRLLGPAAQAGQGETWKQVRFSQDGIGWAKAGSLLEL